MKGMTRRRFLAALGAGAAVAAAPKLLTNYQPPPKPQQQVEPTYTFASDSNTGWYRTQGWHWNKTGPIQQEIKIKGHYA